MFKSYDFSNQTDEPGEGSADGTDIMPVSFRKRRYSTADALKIIQVNDHSTIHHIY